MKYRFALILLSLFCLASFGESNDGSLNDTTCCQAVTLQRAATSGDFDSAYSFRGYRFGTSHMRINGLRMKSVHGRNIWYQVEGGLNIGRARMRSMDFGFRDDKFYGVYALPADYWSYTEVKTILDSVYGAPLSTDSNASSVTYIWNVPKVVVKLRLYWGDRRMDDRRNDRILSLIATPELIDRNGAGKNAAAPDSNP